MCTRLYWPTFVLCYHTMRALLDADLLLYRVGYTTNTETEAIAEWRINELIERILGTVQATAYNLYLSCPRTESFRAILNPEYKAHRTQEKPIHYTFLKDFLIKSWDAKVAVGVEADDLISIEQTKNPDTTIGCTIDKDILYQVEGFKYDFVKDILFYTDKEQIVKYFYFQMLVGDRADNLRGVDKIGKVGAEKLLSGIETEEDMFLLVYEKYNDPTRFWVNADCFWMLREEGEWFSKRPEVERLKTLVGNALES